MQEEFAGHELPPASPEPVQAGAQNPERPPFCCENPAVEASAPVWIVVGSCASHAQPEGHVLPPTPHVKEQYPVLEFGFAMQLHSYDFAVASHASPVFFVGCVMLLTHTP